MAAPQSSRSPRSVSPRGKSKAAKRKKAAPRLLTRAQVDAAVVALAAPAGTGRFAVGKALAATAERDPARVYPHFDAIAGLLGSASKIVRWNVLQMLGALAPVDPSRKLDDVLDRYLEFIQCGNLISAANALQGAGRIAAARPDLHDRIIPAILAVERATYETAECRNVAIRQALDALAAMGPMVCGRRAVRAFVKRQRSSPRAAVVQRAAHMANEWAE